MPPKKTKPNPPASPVPPPVSSARNLPAIATWPSSSSLGYKTPAPHHSALLDLRLSPSANTASIKLRVPVWLKHGPDRATTLYVLLPASRLASVETVAEAPEEVAGVFVQQGLCRAVDEVVGARFSLLPASTIDVVVPAGRVVPRPKFAAVLPLLAALRAAREVTIWVPGRKGGVREVVGRLGQMVREGGVGEMAGEGGLGRLYEGEGGRVAGEGDLEGEGGEESGGDGESLPSYDEIALTPPPRPAKRGRGSESPTAEMGGKKSKAGRTAEELERELRVLTGHIEDIKKQFPAASASAPAPDAAALQSRLAEVEGKVDGLRSDMDAMRTEMQEHVARLEKRFDAKLEDALYRLEEDFNYQIDQVQAHASDEMDVKIDDRILTIREEAYDAVRDEAEASERRIRRDLSRAVVTIGFEDGSP